MLLVAAHLGLGFTPLLMLPGVALGAALWRLLPDDPHALDRPASSRTPSLLRGPVGELTLAASLAAVAVTSFNTGMPLWLSRHGGSAADRLTGWTLALFEVAGAAGGLGAGWASSRVRPSRLVLITMAAAPVSLALVLGAAPGSFVFFAATLAGGALANAPFPLLMLAAQDRAPEAVAAASGMLMGFAYGIAGIAFLAVGVLADAAGLRVGLLAGFAPLVPAAVLSHRALAGRSLPTAAPSIPSRCGGCHLDVAA